MRKQLPLRSWLTLFFLITCSVFLSADVLLGDQKIETNTDSHQNGRAQAFQLTATATGTLSSLSLYVDPLSNASQAAIGVYSDNGGQPSTLLTQVTFSPQAGTWNTYTVPAAQVVAGTPYWIAVLGLGSGRLYYRDTGTACGVGSYPNQTSLPSTWFTVRTYGVCTLSAYGTGPIVSVSVSPASLLLQTGGSQQLTATVSGTTNTGVTWSATGGAVSSSGLYTAPSTPGMYVVTATSSADPTKSASVTVTVAAPVAISVWPTAASLQSGGAQQFSATITGTSNTAASWSATAGSISSTGLYTAPNAAGPYTVTATSAADTTKSASAAVTVTAPVVVSVTPASSSMKTGSTQQFTANVTGTTNTGVVWAATSGTISSGGLYTSPAVAGTYSVTATSVADTTKSATATVTVSAPSPAKAIGFVQAAAATPQSPVSSQALMYPSLQTAGNTNVVIVGWNDTTSSVTSVSDTLGNSYFLAVGPTRGTGLSQAIYYAPNIQGGSNTVTAVFNQPAVYVDLRILEYQGLDPTSPLDMTAGASGNGSSSSSGPVITTVPNELILSANTVSDMTSGPGPGFTSRMITSPNADIAEDEVVTAVGSYSATALLTGGYWVMQMATFKAAGSSSSGPLPVVISVSPTAASVSTGSTQQFTATVTGSTNTNVTWSATRGTVSSAGLYAAPNVSGTCTITATSMADSTKSASATVSVGASATVAVSISPGSASLQMGGTQQFATTVTGTSNTAVSWSATGGSISSTGLYNGPNTAGTYTVTATSAADTSKSASARVTVTAPVAVSPTVVQHVSSSSTRNASMASPYCYTYQLPGYTTAGNAIVAAVTFQGTPTPSFSDDKGNVYSIQENFYDSADNISIAITAAFNVAAGARAIQACFSSNPGNNVEPMATEFANVIAPDGGTGNYGTGTSVAAGSITPTVSGDLVYQVVASYPSGSYFNAQSVFTAGSQSNISWNLLSADLMDGWAAQSGVYNSTAAINPTMSLGTSQRWVSAAILLKSGASGSVPSGARIVRLQHENLPYDTAAGGIQNSWSSTPTALQFPSSGNLLVATVGGGASQSQVVTGVTDSNGNTWAQAGPTQNQTNMGIVSQIFYAANAKSSDDLRPTFSWSGGPGDYNIFFYDVVGAASSPLDTAVGAIGNQSSYGNLTMPYTITPATANEVIFSLIPVDFNTVIGLSGQLSDANTFSGESQNGPEPVDENNGWGHVITTSTAPVGFTWLPEYSVTPFYWWASSSAAFKLAGGGGISSVSLAPVSASLLTGGSQQFTAIVSDTTNTAVTWAATGGTVSTSGLYTAPTTVGTYTVTATSVADATKSASALVSVLTPIQHSVSLNWTASTSAVAGYNVYRATQSGGPYTMINSTLQPGTSYADLSVRSGTAYYYVVTAVDARGIESMYSNQVAAVVP